MTDEFRSLKNEYAGFSMSEKAVNEMEARIDQAKFENRMEARKKHIRNWAVAAAAALTIFILPNMNAGVANAMGNLPGIGGFFQLITLRDFHADNGRQTANVDVAGLKSDDDKTAKKTADEINSEIKSLTDKYVADFKQNEKEKGFENLDVDTEVIDKTDKYFTLKLSALMTQADSYQENHYYTIDINTGKQIQLKDLFKDGADYKTVIRDDVKKQMLDQMKNSDEVMYWAGDTKEDQKEMDYTDNDLINKASFYLNKDGNIVICYNQGDVAPMYMGALEFTIDNSTVNDLLK